MLVEQSVKWIYNEQFCVNWRAETWKILGEPDGAILVKHIVYFDFFRLPLVEQTRKKTHSCKIK